MQIGKGFIIVAIATTLCLAQEDATKNVKATPPNSRKLYYTRTPPATGSPYNRANELAPKNP
ncbi:hypothetical protein GN244_ATG12405 [Phytophthora infestans]|uniref:Secreted RxLR effector peptide protein n=1 Tax=Phytophthora infestans TaxID=4787 RepID=A0A833SMW9_PHYIN|nr:hypothetical protein GN244_ATG12405 [Phytophthora infestans]KAF4138570.1 hypothetical protein GN958_ATG12218 [Phytophthora infestans]